jgi:hypothetical protein
MPFSAADLHGEGSGGRLKGQLLMSDKPLFKSRQVAGIADLISPCRL